MTTVPYHLRVSPGALHDEVRVTRRLLMRGWGAATTEQRIAKSALWLGEMSDHYDIPEPAFRVDPTERSAGRYFLPPVHGIVLPFPSIVTLLHEFRHAVQAFNRVASLGTLQRLAATQDELEDDARTWSLSLYWQTAPRTFTRLVNEGRILFVSPAEVAP